MPPTPKRMIWRVTEALCYEGICIYFGAYFSAKLLQTRRALSSTMTRNFHQILLQATKPATSWPSVCFKQGGRRRPKMGNSCSPDNNPMTGRVISQQLGLKSARHGWITCLVGRGVSPYWAYFWLLPNRQQFAPTAQDRWDVLYALKPLQEI
jgi:hypothetical protein